MRIILHDARKGLLGIAASALLLAASTASGTADGPDFYGVTGVGDGDVLNIRAAPKPSAEKVSEIPPGATCIRNLGCQGGLTYREFTGLTEAQKTARLKENPRWCHVEYQGITGWVVGRYLREGECNRPSLRE
jgi:hypothetical protein